MSDIALEFDPLRFAADLTIVANDLGSDAGLKTAVHLSLFTDRRAEPGDVLPDEETDRRGWWADELAEIEGDKFGSRLWLLARSKDTPDVLERAEQYTREALQWLVDDRAALRIDVVAERLTRVSGFVLVITIHRPRVDPTTFRFNRVWEAVQP